MTDLSRWHSSAIWPSESQAVSPSIRTSTRVRPSSVLVQEELCFTAHELGHGSASADCPDVATGCHISLSFSPRQGTFSHARKAAKTPGGPSKYSTLDHLDASDRSVSEARYSGSQHAITPVPRP